MLAQGNALGSMVNNIPSPEGAKQKVSPIHRREPGLLVSRARSG